MKLRWKLLLAAVSGMFVEIVWITFLDAEAEWLIPVIYGLCGFFFMAGVLWPYVRRTDRFSWRALGLWLASAISFFLAIRMATEWSSGKWGPNAQDYLIASLIGVAVFLVPAVFLLRQAFSLRLVMGGLIAALLGGAAFAVLQDLPLGLLSAFALWHVLMAVALHVAWPILADDGWMAGLSPRASQTAVITLTVLGLLPLADDGIAWLLINQKTNQDGGLTIYEPFELHGFRDQRTKPWYNAGCEFACLDLVRDGTFAFQEYSIDDARGQYVAFFIGQRPDEHCHQYGDDWGSPVDIRFAASSKLDDDRCLTYRISDTPTATFGVRYSITYVDAVLGLYTLTRTTRQVVRIDDHKMMAEVVYYQLDSRLQGYEMGGLDSWETFFDDATPRAAGEWSPAFADDPSE